MLYWNNNKYKEDKKCEVLAKYHERYANDEHVQKVVRFYLETGKRYSPSVYDKEMFLRFFEEIELMIQRKYICEEDVKDLFIFYFMTLWEYDDFCREITDKNSSWPLAEELYNRFKSDKNLMNLAKRTQEEFNHNS